MSLAGSKLGTYERVKYSKVSEGRIYYVRFMLTSALGANRAASSVSLSSFFSLSSRSVRPATIEDLPGSQISLDDRDASYGLTPLPHVDFLCSDRKDIKDPNGYFSHFFHHRRSWRHLSISLEPSKARFKVFEDIYVAFISSRLRTLNIR